MKKSYEKVFWILLVLFIVGLLFRILYPIIFIGDNYPVYPHMFGGMMFPLGMIGMGVFWLVVIYVVFGWITKEQGHHEDGELKYLNIRLANGDISIEEYEKIKQRIKEK